jgi:hypothetical protein
VKIFASPMVRAALCFAPGHRRKTAKDFARVSVTDNARPGTIASKYRLRFPFGAALTDSANRCVKTHLPDMTETLCNAGTTKCTDLHLISFHDPRQHILEKCDDVRNLPQLISLFFTAFEASGHDTGRTVRGYSAPESKEGLKRSEVPQCLNSGKEKISAVPERCECWQAYYLFADRPLRHAEIEGAILVAYEWVSFVAQFVKIRIIDPDILCELKLPYEDCNCKRRRQPIKRGISAQVVIRPFPFPLTYRIDGRRKPETTISSQTFCRHLCAFLRSRQQAVRAVLNAMPYIDGAVQQRCRSVTCREYARRCGGCVRDHEVSILIAAKGAVG